MGCSETIIKQDNTMEIDFMILFEESDFKDGLIMLSKEKRTSRIANKLPRRYKSYKITDVGKLGLIIMGIPQLYTLYIRLPKQNIWIQASLWEEEMLSQQNDEIIKVYTELGAKEIKCNIHNMNKNSFGISANIDNPANVNIGGNFDSSKQNENDIQQYIKIENPIKKTYNNIDEFMDKNKIYYLKSSPSLLNNISLKLEHPEIKIFNTQFTFTHGIHYNAKLEAKFNNIGIDLGIKNNQNNKIIIKYDVLFE